MEWPLRAAAAAPHGKPLNAHSGKERGTVGIGGAHWKHLRRLSYIARAAIAEAHGLAAVVARGGHIAALS